jgi:hypothetical protein
MKPAEAIDLLGKNDSIVVAKQERFHKRLLELKSQVCFVYIIISLKMRLVK